MNSIDNLYRVQNRDLQKAVDVLDNAFSEDSQWKEVFKDEEKNRMLTEILVRFCLKYGRVVSTSENMEGVMALAPYGKEMNAWRLARSGAFFLSMRIAREAKVMQVLTRAVEDAKKSLNLGPHIHLLIMGVSKESQGKGFGGQLLRALIEDAERQELPIYLETQKESNVGLYERFGFTLQRQVALPSPLNLPMWLMVRYSH